MNYMKQVADMLGVELEQEFKLKGISKVFKITKDGMYMKTALTDDWLLVNYAIGSILIGDHEVKKTILDQAEKEYLSAVIKPFRKRIKSIKKAYNSGNSAYISIAMDKCEHIYLPYFNLNSGMYKRMETDKEYTLKDLEL